jgi:hypothetical protein
MKKFFTLFIFCMAFLSQAQNDYFFPKNLSFNPNIPSPEQFLGYPIGEWHTRHDRIVSYFEKLAALSPKAEVFNIGQTNEHRPQVYLLVSTPENLSNKENIRQQHLKVKEPNAAANTTEPLIIQLGYGVHGNEASSAEAAMLAAYYLVAGQGAEVETYLKNALVFIEPVLNPDGRDRHTLWVNARRGNPPVGDPLDSEHQEAWPGGRTNHYWFDLNRDWLPLAQVESQNRVAFFHKWLPNVVTDYHEMGTDATYFFEPTKKYSSENPIIPRYHYDVINPTYAKYFQEALDAYGALYWSREVFDNSYPGYGSTYPDIHGGLGIVFEQARSEGRIQNTTTIPLEFKFAIRNHLRTSIAILKATYENKEMMQSFQKQFFTDAYNQGKKENAYYVFGDDHDASRTQKFVELLQKHQIETYEISENFSANGYNFKKGSAYVVPTDQPQYLMVRSVFENVKQFHDSVFYDTSAWSMALAFNMPHAVVKQTKNLKGAKVTAESLKKPVSEVKKASYAYVVDWADYNAPRFLAHLLEKNVFVKTAFKPFPAKTDKGDKNFGYGSLMISVADQRLDSQALHTAVSEAAKAAQMEVYTVETGLNIGGIDLGSRNFNTVQKPKILMPIGEGVSAYEAGEIWHLLDTRVDLPITKIDVSDLNRVNLYDYNVMILVSGNHNRLNKDKVKDWINAGGTLIVQRSAIPWAIRNGLTTATPKKNEAKADSLARGNYVEAQDFYGSKETGGSYYETMLDITHPVGFGFTSPKLTVYRNSNVFLNPGKNRFGKVALYTANPHISGYVHTENLNIIKNSASILAHTQGRGAVVLFADNPNFRGFMYGTNKVFLNALFFGSLISTE